MAGSHLMLNALNAGGCPLILNVVAKYTGFILFM